MPLLILAIVIAVPLIEVGLFIEVGGALGLWPTLGLSVLTAVLGLWLVRLQGFAVVTQARGQLERGELPARELFDGICLALAGGLLLLPGFATDLLGALLLLPPVRAWLFARSRLRAERLRMRTRVYRDGEEVYRSDPESQRRRGGTIEGEWVELDGEAEPPANDPGRRGEPPRLGDRNEP